MPRGKKISPDMQWAILRLNNFLNIEQIAMCLGLSTHSIERVNSHFCTHGTIQDEDPAEKRKIRRNLREVDVEVCH